MRHQCVLFSAKKNIKGQNTEVMKFNSRQLMAINPLSQDRNCGIKVKMIKHPD